MDFLRGRLDGDEYRGSLFVSQELAIATFLKLDGIGFVENGVRREGIAEYQIYNAIRFGDVREIMSALERETADWDKDSVNELAIERSETSKGVTIQNQQVSDWYHLEVKNRSKRKDALSCLAYVTKLENMESGEAFDLPTTELNWAAIGDVTAHIIAGTHRDLDAFLIIHGESRIRFHQRALGTSNPKYRLPDLDPGRYRIEYTVISANFTSVKAQFELEFTGTPDSVRFEQTEADDP